jgi:hypothetical protein
MKKNQTANKINTETVNAELKETIMETTEVTATASVIAEVIAPVMKSNKGIVIQSCEQVAGKRMNETRIYHASRKAEAESYAANAKASGNKVKVFNAVFECDEDNGKGIVIQSCEQVAGKRMNETKIFHVSRKAEAESYAANAKASGNKVKVFNAIFA